MTVGRVPYLGIERSLSQLKKGNHPGGDSNTISKRLFHSLEKNTRCGVPIHTHRQTWRYPLLPRISHCPSLVHSYNGEYNSPGLSINYYDETRSLNCCNRGYLRKGNLEGGVREGNNVEAMIYDCGEPW